MTIKVIVADPFPLVVLAEERILTQSGLDVVATAHHAVELVDVLQNTPCDLVVMDLFLSDPNPAAGLALIDHILRHHPSVAIVVFTAQSQPQVLQSLLDHGVLGLVDKGAPLIDLSATVGAVTVGERYLSPGFDALLGTRPQSTRLGNFARESIDVSELAAR